MGALLIFGAGLRGLAGFFAGVGSTGAATGAGEIFGEAAGVDVFLAEAGDFLREPFSFAGGVVTGASGLG